MPLKQQTVFHVREKDTGIVKEIKKYKEALTLVAAKTHSFISLKAYKEAIAKGVNTTN